VLLTRPRAQLARTSIGVPPRLLPEGDLLPKALLQAMFPGTRRSVILLHPPSGGRTSAVLAGVTRPNLSQSSEHLALRSLVPEDWCPKPPGSGLQRRPRAPPSRSLPRCASGADPLASENHGGIRIWNGDICQRNGDITFPSAVACWCRQATPSAQAQPPRSRGNAMGARAA